MTSTLRFSVGLAAGCALAVFTTHTVSGAVRLTHDMGPAALDEALKRYDETPAGPVKDALSNEVDQIAGQRYATISRLYWYTDFAAAKAAAQKQHLPILSLRMLGRLDEDLSCANSRLFRATLYANTEIRTLLHDHFILYWSSERPVPKVTVDFGDGRKIETTTTGNSAHYILDEDGTVLDVLPGLYAPVAFRIELDQALVLATTVRGLSTTRRADAIVSYHRRAISAARAALADTVDLPYLSPHRLMTSADVKTALELAQRAAMSKARVEVPMLRRIALGVDPGTLVDPTAWMVVGQRLYHIGDLAALGVIKQPHSAPFDVVAPHEPVHAPAHVLDAASLALVTRLYDARPKSHVPGDRASMIDRLEAHLVADGAQNQLQLRPQISQHMVDQGLTEDFATLNAWIYANVFQTPASDAWLGLLPRTDFTGLPGDGVVMP